MSLVTNTHWFDNSSNANKLRQSYLRGFLDISGGAVQLRADNSMNFYTGAGDADSLSLSIGPNKLTMKAFDLSLTEVDVYSLAALKGLTTNVQQYINEATNGTASGNFDQLQVANQDITGNVTVGKTLVVGGNATFRQNVGVAGNLQVEGDAYLNKALIVGGNCTIDGALTVLGDVSMNKFHLSGSTISAAGDVSLNNNLFVNLDTSMNGKLRVGSDASFGNNVEVAGQLKCTSLVIGNNTSGDSNAITFNQKFIVSDDTDLQNKLFVGEDASLNGKLYVALDASMDAKLSVGSDASFGAKLAVASDVSFSGKLLLSGDASMNAKLWVAADASFGAKLAVASDVSFNTKMVLGGDASLNGRLSVDLDASFGAKMAVASDVSFSGKLVLGSDASLNAKLWVAADASFGAKMAVASDVSFSGQLVLGGDATMNGSLDVATKITTPEIEVGSQIVIDPTGDHTLTLKTGPTGAVISSKTGNININPTVNNGEIGVVHINSALIVDGSINFTGNFIRTDTNVQFTTQVEVTNDGTAPAMKIAQIGTNKVAQFLYGTATAMEIITGGNVAIGGAAGSAQLHVAADAKIGTKLMVSGTVDVSGSYTSAAGNMTLTAGKLTAATMEITADATFDANATVTSKLTAGTFESLGVSAFGAEVTVNNNSNIKMNGGYLEQF